MCASTERRPASSPTAPRACAITGALRRSDTTARLRIVAVGGRLRGELDGEALFDVADGVHVTGRVALHCRLDPGAVFSAVEVTEVPWVDRALVRDRFVAGDVAAWTIVDTGAVGGPSAWALDDGVWQQGAMIHGPPPDDDDTAPGTLAIANTDEMLTATVLRATLSLFARGAAGLVFRYRDPANHYRFSFDAQRGQRLLILRRNGVTETLWWDRFEAVRDVAYDVVIRAIGDQLTVFWNGVPLCHLEDGTLTKGAVGLYSRNRGARFSDVWAHAPDASAPPPRVQPDDELDGGGDDHRITVQIAGLMGGSAGVVVRRAGPETFYALVVDHDNQRIQLRSHLDGVVVVLWDEDLPRMVGERFSVSLACQGPVLTAWVDGVMLTRLDDHSIAYGCGAGVLAEQNPDVFFHLLELAPPAWLPWHRFAPLTAPAGTRLVAHGRASGLAPGAVQPSLALPSAPAGTRGHPRLRAPLALRLVDRDRRPVHVYQHRLVEDYTPATARLLRVTGRA